MKRKVWMVIFFCFMGMLPRYGDKKGAHYLGPLFGDHLGDTRLLSSVEISAKKGHVLKIVPLSWIPKKGVALSMLSYDGTRLLTEGQLGLRLYDSQQGRHLQTFPKGRNIDVAALSSHGQTVISGTKRFTTILNVWDAQSGQRLHTFHHFAKPVTCVGFHPQKPVIITGAEDIRLWDADTFDEVARVPLGE